MRLYVTQLISKRNYSRPRNFIRTGFETSSPVFSGMFTRFVEQPGEFITLPGCQNIITQNKYVMTNFYNRQETWLL